MSDFFLSFVFICTPVYLFLKNLTCRGSSYLKSLLSIVLFKVSTDWLQHYCFLALPVIIIRPLRDLKMWRCCEQSIEVALKQATLNTIIHAPKPYCKTRKQFVVSEGRRNLFVFALFLFIGLLTVHLDGLAKGSEIIVFVKG